MYVYVCKGPTKETYCNQKRPTNLRLPYNIARQRGSRVGHSLKGPQHTLQHLWPLALRNASNCRLPSSAQFRLSEIEKSAKREGGQEVEEDSGASSNAISALSKKKRIATRHQRKQKKSSNAISAFKIDQPST